MFFAFNVNHLLGAYWTATQFTKNIKLTTKIATPPMATKTM